MLTFLPHQEAGYARVQGRSCLALFWEMRLGKTLVTIRWAKHQLRDLPKARVLVVAPLTVLESWERELKREGLPLQPLLTRNKRTWLEQRPQPGWHFTNYETLALRTKRDPANPKKRTKAKPGPIAQQPWDLVILDESTYIRKPTSKTNKIARRFLGWAPRRAVLSGMPAPEGSIDYFEQMCFCFGEFMGHRNYYQFRNQYYMLNTYGSYEWIARKGTTELVRQEVNRLADVLTRKQCNIGNVKVREVRRVDLPKPWVAASARLERDFGLGDWFSPHGVAQRLLLQRIAGGQHVVEGLDLEPGGHKLAELKGLVEGELKGERMLVFCRFNSEVHAVAEALGALTLTGDDKLEVRQRRLEFFRERPGTILACQTRLVKMGIDLSAADTIVFFSNWEEYEIRAQAEDRVIHPTKTEPALILDLQTRNTIDEDIHWALKEKGACAKYFMRRAVELLALRAGLSSPSIPA